MKKITLLLVFIVFALPLVLADNSCEDFCLGEGYDYGSCQETTDLGFCGGNSAETVFGFDQCSDLNRCCCGYDEGIIEESIEPQTGGAGSESTSLNQQLNERSVAENLFWFLLIVVVILGVANYITPPKRKKTKDEEFEELI